MFVPSALAVDPNPSYQDKGDFYLIIEPTENFKDYEVWLEEEQYFETQIPFLNETFKLPYDVGVVVTECGEENAWYDPNEKTIVMCYELLHETAWRFANSWDEEGYEWTDEELSYSWVNVIEGVFYHEVGHALIAIYELPTTGPEESVADQFAAYILLEFPYEDDPTNSLGQDAMSDTAWDYQLRAQEYPNLTESAFADTHALDQQRFYDLACWAYGSDPNYNQYMIDLNWIPEHRLVWCESEYYNGVYAWDVLLAPFAQYYLLQETYSVWEDSEYQYLHKFLGKSQGGGCLIATAAFGSEMAPQVQFLRELRDNTVLQTESGSAFMIGFNQFYYSFSPAIADYERENPAFKESVKITLTPLLISLTLLQYVDIDSESEMLGYGIGVILLNIGMYFVVPAVLIMKIRKWIIKVSP